VDASLAGEITSTINVNPPSTVTAGGLALLVGRRNSLGIRVEGRYSLGLVNGQSDGMKLTYNLSQSGSIPMDANSIFFKASFNTLSLQIDGQELSPIFLESTTSGFDLFGADIRGFSGRTVELDFFTRPVGFNEGYVIDSVSFSPVIVPEPGSLSLFGMILVATFLINEKKTFKNQRFKAHHHPPYFHVDK
jgi:hypothetical protein